MKVTGHGQGMAELSREEVGQGAPPGSVSTHMKW